MASTYTVKKGDTLSEIAVTYKNDIEGATIWDRVDTLVKLNNIKDPDYIVVGQVLKLNGEADAKKENNTSRVVIDVFGLQSNTDRTMYITWTWDKEHTENYQVIWYYDTGDKVWFIGSDSEVEDKQSLYSAPENALRVKVKIKPLSEKKDVNGSETTYWTASWSTEKTYDFSDNPPQQPDAPSVDIVKYQLTAELDASELNATSIQFQIVKNNESVFKTGTAKIVTDYASYSCTVDAGHEYKVRCRSERDGRYSDWSAYTDNIKTIPSPPTGITTIRATSKTSIYLEWSAVNTAETYDLEYATKKDYFDNAGPTTPENDIKFTHCELFELESGHEYFFRVRAVNEKGTSAWSDVKSVVIGTDPSAPTTWSSTTTVVTGEPLTLYWVHNSEDGSSQTYAELELDVDGVKEVYTIQNSTEEDEKDKTSVYVIDTSEYAEGVKILWRVRTAGVTKEYGDWSAQRTIDIYAPATLQLEVTNQAGDVLETLTSFPFYIYALAGPSTQLPISYHVTITANEAYETVDNVGNVKLVNKGGQVYSKYFDTSDPLTLELSAGHIDLENNITYTITCEVAMNSGLKAVSDVQFKVAWTDEECHPNAEIGIDLETLSAHIRPFCANIYGVPLDDILLAVYRREYDGTFTELATGLDNTKNTYITDPHPALDYARYRVVATTKSTGAVSYYDVPGIPVGEKAAVIQWDEVWSSFDVSDEDEFEQPAWSGSMLKLPYNLDVSDSSSPDVSLIEYIGREHPVTYYGTQLGETSSWNVEIERDDVETLYALRRLRRWMGDVYVREPSGSGYWANIKVSFNQKHCGLTIPVGLDITRVEGGV